MTLTFLIKNLLHPKPLIPSLPQITSIHNYNEKQSKLSQQLNFILTENLMQESENIFLINGVKIIIIQCVNIPTNIQSYLHNILHFIVTHVKCQKVVRGEWVGGM